GSGRGRRKAGRPARGPAARSREGPGAPATLPALPGGRRVPWVSLYFWMSCHCLAPLARDCAIGYVTKRSCPSNYLLLRCNELTPVCNGGATTGSDAARRALPWPARRATGTA